MKIEFRIARGNVKDWKEIRITKDGNSNAICKEHKSSCERGLDFLNGEFNEFLEIEKSIKMEFSLGLIVVYNSWKKRIKMKINDLKQAIKHYKNNGI